MMNEALKEFTADNPACSVPVRSDRDPTRACGGTRTGSSGGETPEEPREGAPHRSHPENATRDSKKHLGCGFHRN